MNRVDQWSNFAELLGNLIAKYADVLDIDSMKNTDTKSNIKDEEKNIKISERNIA